MGQPPSITSFTECKCRQHLKAENQGGSKMSCLLNFIIEPPHIVWQAQYGAVRLLHQGIFFIFRFH